MTDKNEMAEDRTDWAEDRTYLANERTFAGWMRTGMAAVAVAIGLKAVFGATDPTWVAKSVATIFLGIALFIFWNARRQACLTNARLTTTDAEAQGKTNFTIIAIVLSCGALGTGVILWLI